MTGTCGPGMLLHPVLWSAYPSTHGTVVSSLILISEPLFPCPVRSILPLDVICNRIQADVMATLKDDQDTKTVLAEAGLINILQQPEPAAAHQPQPVMAAAAVASNGNGNGNGAAAPSSSHGNGAAAAPAVPGAPAIKSITVSISPR